MSSTWSHEGQHQIGGHQMHQPSTPMRRATNPPPVCFKCGGEHFLVDCPASQTSNTGFAPSAVLYQQAPAAPSQQYSQGNQSQYPAYQPNQQYVPPPSQYQYNQPSQPYTAPAPTPPPYGVPPSGSQYSRPGYQASPYNQSSGPPQYPAAPYQPLNVQYNARGPSPYQTSPSNYQTQNNGGHRGGYQSAPVSGPYHPPPPQWNGTPSVPQVPHPKPRNNGNYKREFSGAPSHNSQQQHYRQSSRSQSLQLDHPIKTSQSPSSQGLQSSPPKATTKSVPSTPASHADTRRGSSATINPKPDKNNASEKGKAEVKEVSEQETEEGEVCEGDEEEEIFQWELKQIFKEPPAAETVALAQPLSAGYESTPVPLVQAWSTSIPSISRYARKDNLKEFIKSVRVAPQWSYLQEDPAFAEISDDGESIPLTKIGAWMDIHHGRELEMNGAEDVEITEEVGEPDDLEPISRKRSRDERDLEEEENQQEDVDDQIALEIGKELKGDKPPNKRQKNNDDANDDDQVMQSSGGRTPIIMGRGGTPCLATTDDAWAPQPGETATSPGDPTENLLASLGVSGDPKPRKQPSIPPVSKEEESHSEHQALVLAQVLAPVKPKSHFKGPNPQAPLPNTETGGPQNGRSMPYDPQGNAQFGPPAMPYGNGTAPNIPYGNGSQPNVPQGPPQGYQGYNQGPPQGYVQGYPQDPPQGPPQIAQGNPQYVPAMSAPLPMSAPYGNGPHNAQGPPQYGPHVNGPPNNYPQGQQWGPQGNPSFGPAAPYASQQYPQYPQSPPYGNHNYGPPANQYQGAPVQYPQGPPQYNQARQPSYGSGPAMGGQYGPVAQNSPVQYGQPQYGQPQYGPPQNVPYTAGQYPNQHQYQSGPANGYVNGPVQGPSNNAPYANLPPNSYMPPNSNIAPNQMQNGHMPNGQMMKGNTFSGNAPPRQDSGYLSARGSYSNGSGRNGSSGFNNQGMPQDQGFPDSQPTQGQPFSDSTNQQSPRSGTQGSECKVKGEKPRNVETSVKAEGLDSNTEIASNETASNGPGTPLSPNSAEIIRLLEGKPKKSTRASLPRKAKAQPVVNEAYSRRW